MRAEGDDRSRGETAPPRVTVVVPAHDAAWSLDETLASVAAQTLADFEAVVVDDGSTDDTAAIAQAWADRDPRFRVVSQANAGVAAARNRGFREARAPYVAPIDSDDLWAPENLERQVAALDAAGPEALLCHALSVCVDEGGRPLPSATSVPDLSPDFRKLLLRNTVGNGSAAVFRRDAVLLAGGYDPSLKARGGQGAEDWKLILTLASRGRVVVAPEPLIFYRISRSSMSHRFGVMARGLRLAIQDVRRTCPPVEPRLYAHALTLANVWLLPRMLSAGAWADAGAAFWRAYVLNPFWWTLPEPRWLLRRLARQPWGRLSGAGRSTASSARPTASDRYVASTRRRAA